MRGTAALTIAAIALLLAGCESGGGNSPPPAAGAGSAGGLPLAQVRQAYDNCFYASVNRQVKAGAPHDAETLSAKAFADCQAEGNRLAASLGGSASAGQVDKAMDNIRQQLKTLVPEVIAHPSVYVR